MKLLVAPLESVARLCAAHAPSHLVSWLSPPATPPDLPQGAAPLERLLLSSHDVDQAADGLEPPSRTHVLELLAFAAGWTGERPMLAHCWAGVSRSTAAAYVVACQKRPDFSERELARRLRAASPTATPNRLIVQIADDLLGRGGRMTQAIGEIGRGAEATLGRPGVLRLD